MNFCFKLVNDVLIVSLVGRLDTDASMSFENEFAVITKENPHSSLVFDASELDGCRPRYRSRSVVPSVR